MAKVGDSTALGTAEGALTGRAAHALHAREPVLDDFWAIELLTPEAQAVLRDPENYRQFHSPDTSPFSATVAVGMGCLRYAEDEVERLIDQGVKQYVLLGAGFDTFALRRADLVDRVSVFEVDHPDVQKLKCERIEAATATPAALPEFVPVDFEIKSALQGLAASNFDPSQRSVFSWMNTLPYLTPEAVSSTLDDLSTLAAAGSRLIVNYIPVAAPTPEQAELMKAMSRYAAGVGEAHRKPWEPDRLTELLTRKGFETLEQLTEDDLIERYFRDREDGFAPGLPTRVILAERTTQRRRG